MFSFYILQLFPKIALSANSVWILPYQKSLLFETNIARLILHLLEYQVFLRQSFFYNFSTILSDAQKAYNSTVGRGTFGFGVRCLVEGVTKSYPAYLDAATNPKKMTSWYSTLKTSWVPDWNNEYFLTRVDSLMANLARVFGNEPKIGFIEVRTFGDWGEFHMYGYETPPSPLAVVSTISLKHMIDAHINAFPNKQIIVMSDNDFALSYAMNKTGLKYPIGWRRDSWCNTHFEDIKNNSSAWPIAKDRWKTAPVIIESYSSDGVTASLGPKQVRDYHISNIGNGNFSTAWGTLSLSDRDSLLKSASLAGYRYVLRNVTYPNNLKVNKKMIFKSTWSNVGNSPAYRKWNVVYRLLNSSNIVMWQDTSKVDLKTILPTQDANGKDTPIICSDEFLIPISILPGKYNFEIIILDDMNYSNPLRLGIIGRKSNGAYPICDINVIP